MPSHQQPPRKRRRLSTSSDDTNASSDGNHQGGTPSATANVELTHSPHELFTTTDYPKPPIVTTSSIDQFLDIPSHEPTCLPYRTYNDSTSSDTTRLPSIVTTTTVEEHTNDPQHDTNFSNQRMITLPYTPPRTPSRTSRRSAFNPPQCLPHLSSPYPPPVAPNPATATLDDKAEYNMDYLEWKGLDEQWRREHLLELASFMMTWRQTMINMVYILYEGQYWALREAGVLMGLIKPESRGSFRRRVEEGMRRTAEVERVRIEWAIRRGRRLDEEMERIGVLLDKWRREREE